MANPALSFPLWMQQQLQQGIPTQPASGFQEAAKRQAPRLFAQQAENKAMSNAFINAARTSQPTMSNVLKYGAGQVASKAAVPLAVVSALAPIAEAHSQQMEKTGQAIPTTISSSHRPTTSWSAPTSTLGISNTNPFTGEVHKNTFNTGIKAAAPKPEESEYRSSLTGPARYDVNSPEFDLVRNHFLTAANLPYEPPKKEGDGSGGAAKPAPSALPAPPEYDPRYLNDVKDAYAQQRGDIDSRLASARDIDMGMANAFLTPQGTSFGGLMANQIGLDQGAKFTARGADTHKDAAHLVGALPLLGNTQQASATGGAAQREAQAEKFKTMFREAQPSTQAEIEARKAQTVGSLASAEHAKAQASALPTHTLTEATKAAIAAKKESAHPYVGELLKMLPNIPDNKEYNKYAALIAKLTGGEILMPKREEK